jgi:uncharacterized protein (TIGR03083 family)
MDYLSHLAADAARLREVAARDLSAPVPSCPDWTVADLVRHVAEVYLHKTECMRGNGSPAPRPGRPTPLARPEEWPPDLSAEEPLALFDRAFTALTGEFAARSPDSPAWTWYSPEQDVGFWIRRMAQETVIHRVDAELALGVPVRPIPDDLAVDGVDEVLERFLGYGSRVWREEFGNLLDDLDGRAVRVAAGDRSWVVALTKDGVVVSARGDTAATVSGAPQPVLLWLWRRAGDDVVGVDGDRALVAKARELLGVATQ